MFRCFFDRYRFVPKVTELFKTLLFIEPYIHLQLIFFSLGSLSLNTTIIVDVPLLHFLKTLNGIPFKVSVIAFSNVSIDAKRFPFGTFFYFGEQEEVERRQILDRRETAGGCV